jgi:hypothetical protein
MFPLLLFSIYTMADINVKENLHVNAGYRYGQMYPEADSIGEWWYGDNRVSLVDGGFRFTLDKKNKRLLVVNISKKTYVEIPIPFKAAAHLDEGAVKKRELVEIFGTVKRTGEKKKIAQKECELIIIVEKMRYLSETLTYHNQDYYDRDKKAMVTTDVPFDWRLKKDLFRNLRTFFKHRDDFLMELEKIDGCEYSSENVLYFRGMKLLFSIKVVQIQEQKAPEGIYGIPTGFEKSESLTFSELRLIREVMYPGSTF